ncbi:prostaglandin reductase 1 isoform X1 [Leptinotarsa decemlineata]|uniref:prostaglandin reductase 1 isoform X1 n=2 Tax=Leptinotarsa decemlineata TaxID=7539 RepID=UPI003D30B7FC
MVIAKVYKFVKQFDGLPKKSDFEIVEEELPSLKDGQVLTEAVYMSVDPYMRAYAPTIPVGCTMIGSQIAKIIESKNPKFPVGKYVVGNFGWRSHTIWNGKSTTDNSKAASYLLPDLKGFTPSLGLGVLGMPGNTAAMLFSVIQLLLYVCALH